MYKYRISCYRRLPQINAARISSLSLINAALIMAFKLKVVAYAEEESSRGAARRFGVDEKRVREWRKLKVKIAERPEEKAITGIWEERPFLRLTRRSS